MPSLLGVAGAWLGLAILGTERVQLGPFQVELRGQLGRGVTEIALPPLGRLTADTHGSPLALRATLVDAGFEELAERYRNRSSQDLAREVERDALRAIGPFAVRLAVAGAIGGVVLSSLAFRLRWRPVAVSLVASLLVVGTVELGAWASYRPQAFLAPRFSGSLALAPRLVGPVEQATGRIDDFRAELGRIVDGTLRVYATIPTGGGPSGNQIKVLHISDIHLSPLGLAFARQVADSFDVDVVIDTGDVTSFGTEFEGAFVSLVRRFDQPYVLAPGNHDDPDALRALDRIADATALDGDTIEAGGLTIYGRSHPVFTQDAEDKVDDDTFADAARAAADDILRDLALLEAPPDILAVHDDRMAEALAGSVPLVISGHFHHAGARESNGTIYLRAGSTGGEGFTVFSEEGLPLSLQVLHLTREAPHRLVAWDVIEQSPQTGSLTLERHRVEEEFDLPPTPSPTGPGSPHEAEADLGQVRDSTPRTSLD